MALTRRSISAVILLCLALAQGAMAEKSDTTYQLGPGDVLSIHVYGEEDLSFDDVKLSGRGKISYPFLGEIDADGLTVTALEQLLIDGLKPDYLIDPRVVVSIRQYRQFFVNGEVGEPGGYPYQPGLTLRKAISLAGGFTERASKSKLQVIGEDDPDGESRSVNLDYKIKPGDIVTVKQSFF